MASTYTTELRIEKIETGAQAGTWGTTTNTQYDLWESAISGTSTVAFVSDGNDTLSTANGSDDESRHAIINLSGGSTLTATREMVCPTSSKLYIVDNNTTGGQSVTFKTTSGTGITIPNGDRMFLYCDGTNVVDAMTATNLTGGTIAVAGGGTGAQTLTDGGILLGSGTSAITAMSALADGAMVVGDGSTDPVALAAFTSSTGTLKHESGGTEADLSAVADGDFVVGTGAGTMGLESGATVRTTMGLGTFAVENIAAVPAQTLAGAITGGDQIVSAVTLKDYGETEVAHGNTSTTETIDLTGGNVHSATLDANCTFTFSNPTASGDGCSFTLILTQDGTGSRTVTWPSSVDWPNSTAPTLSTAAAARDVFTFATIDGGTIWYGFTGGLSFG